MMTNYNDMFVGIELLMGSAWNVSHGDVHRSFDLGSGNFPRFADIEKNRSTFSLKQRLGFHGSNFVIQANLDFP